MRLNVMFNNDIVGYLEEINDNQIAFQYSEEWLRNGFSISPFHLPLMDKVFVSKSEHFSGLYGVFSDSLPDGWGELLVRRMLREQEMDFDDLSALERLAIVRSNGLGGLSYKPSKAEKLSSNRIDLDRLSEEASMVLNDEDGDFDSLFEMGGASGGARPKAHVMINFEEWIVKFPSSLDPIEIGVREYNTNKLAKEAGIDVNEFNLFPSKKHGGYFGAKRFDRENNKRKHVISLSSLLETSHRIPNLDYKILFQVIVACCEDQKDLYEAFKRMVFNVLIGNKDDHGKNFAIMYDEELKGYKLSPAYDLTKARNKINHEMSVLNNDQPNKKNMFDLANEFGLSNKKCNEIYDRIERVINENDKIL